MLRYELKNNTYDLANPKELLECTYPQKNIPIDLNFLIAKLEELGHISFSINRPGGRTFLYAPVWVESIFSKDNDTN